MLCPRADGGSCCGPLHFSSVPVLPPDANGSVFTPKICHYDLTLNTSTPRFLTRSLIQHQEDLLPAGNSAVFTLVRTGCIPSFSRWKDGGSSTANFPSWNIQQSADSFQSCCLLGFHASCYNQSMSPLRPTTAANFPPSCFDRHPFWTHLSFLEAPLMYKCKLSPQQVSNCGRMSSFSQLSYRVCSICINQKEQTGSLNRPRHRLFPVAPHRPLQKCFPSISQNNSWAPTTVMHPEKKDARKARLSRGNFLLSAHLSVLPTLSGNFKSSYWGLCVSQIRWRCTCCYIFIREHTWQQCQRSTKPLWHIWPLLSVQQGGEIFYRGLNFANVSFTIFVFPSKVVSVGCK